MSNIIMAIRNYDESILKGMKTYLTLAVIFASVCFMPEEKLSSFVEVLGLVHLFALRCVK